MSSSRASRVSFGRTAASIRLLSRIAPLLLLAAPARTLAQQTVGCGCYCGKVLAPPCSDDACKSACGWQGSSSSSGSSAAGGAAYNLGYQLGSAIGRALFAPRPPESPEARAARLEREARAREEAARRAQAAREEAERRAAELRRLSEKGQALQSEADAFDGFGRLVVEREKHPERFLDEAFQPIADGAVKLEGTTPQLLRGPEPRGGPIVDCEAARAKRDRLAAGLGTSDEALRRTREQARAAKDAHGDAIAGLGKDAAKHAFDGIFSFSGDFLKHAGEIQAKAGAAGAKLASHPQWTAAIADLHEEIEWFQNLRGLGEETLPAGVEFGDHLRKRSAGMKERIARLDKLFVDSGLAQELGLTLSKTGGPFGELAFRAASFGIDAAARAGEAAIEKESELDAQRSLETMEAQRRRVSGEIAELELDLAERCARKP